MNLKEFLEYRTLCPICENLLVTSFHSQKRQSICYEDNKFVVSFDMNGLNGEGNFEVKYSFDMEDNSWYVNFYPKFYSDKVKFDIYTPKFIRDKFKTLDKNLGSYKFYKYCPTNHYNYSSNLFNLNFKTASISGISIWSEYFGMSKKHESDNMYKIYKLLNYNQYGISKLLFLRHAEDDVAAHINDFFNNSPFGILSNLIEMPLIKFTSKDEVMDRLQTLITFS